MKVHVLQHVPFEDIGSMAGWLAARDAAITYTRFFEADAQLPDPAAFDLVIAMGGPMSVNDEAALPWLVAEKRFVRAVLERGTPLLGICLGAQLIASALGARVYPNTQKEIGWFDIEAQATAATFRFPERARVFHWHGETFDLPSGATRIARSAACANQAFQIGERAIGLQFHLETTPDSARLIAQHCRDELIAAPYVQDEATLLAEPIATYDGINALMGAVLEYVLRD